MRNLPGRIVFDVIVCIIGPRLIVDLDAKAAYLELQRSKKHCELICDVLVSCRVRHGKLVIDVNRSPIVSHHGAV